MVWIQIHSSVPRMIPWFMCLIFYMDVIECFEILEMSNLQEQEATVALVLPSFVCITLARERIWL